VPCICICDRSEIAYVAAFHFSSIQVDAMHVISVLVFGLIVIDERWVCP
jgi:hypothetical protein